MLEGPGVDVAHAREPSGGSHSPKWQEAAFRPPCTLGLPEAIAPRSWRRVETKDPKAKEGCVTEGD